MSPGGSAPGQLPFADANGLAHALDPLLHDACDGRLGPIEWFHAAWQRGGSATGFSTWLLGDTRIGVVVKLPLDATEYVWTTALGAADEDDWHSDRSRACVCPRVLRHGDALGPYPARWVVCERLAGDHFPHHLTPAMVEELMERLLAFHTAAAGTPLGERPRAPDFEKLVDKGRAACRDHNVAEYPRWSEALRKVHRALPALIGRWEHRPINTWCHGDLHPGNVLRRGEGDGARCVLIDLALVHPGHWIEDALYLERQYWGHEDWLARAKPVSILARLRRERGLPVTDNYAELANVRRVLMAACAPALIEREGNPKYLHSALEHIERLLPQVPH
ncbi:MAG TPA: aminoglycoside phosphotransferase family protein [Phycisphaerales bacterium]|nr:aminoglycoside phosphotransferase family protein [Phycisphaerales bacterium]